MTKNKNILFASEAKFQKQDDENKKCKLPTFEMHAYTGAKVYIWGFKHPVVVDLRGVDCSKQNIKIFREHDYYRGGIGHATEVSVDLNSGIYAKGVISRENGYSKDVVDGALNGYPWEASIGGPVIESTDYAQGQTVEVNGTVHEGPVTVVNKMKIKEISFCEFGADENTTTKIEANSIENNIKFSGYTIEENDQFSKCNMKESNMTVKKESLEVLTETEEKTADVVNLSAQNANFKEEKASPKIDEAVKNNVNDFENKFSELQASFEKKMLEMMERKREEDIAETKRIRAIRDVGKGQNVELENKAIEEGWSVDKFELHCLRENRPSAPSIHVNNTVMNNKVLEAIALNRCCIPSERREKMFDEQTLEAADKYRRIGLRSFCELACNKPLPNFEYGEDEWMRAAFSTISLPGILSNVANKMLLEGFNNVDDSWRKVCKIGSVNNFLTHTRYRMTGDFKYEKIAQGGEITHGEIGEESFTQKIDTYGKMFSLERQMIINDDLGAFFDIPRQIGIGAAEAISDAVWSLILSNPVKDGVAFFSDTHNNLYTGSASALSINALTEARKKFSKQTKTGKEGDIRPLGIFPSILLVPTELEVTADMLMKYVDVNESTTTNVPKIAKNPHVGKYEVVSTPYLSVDAFTGHSSTAWYLMADPNRLPVIEVAFLGGVDRPTVRQADAEFNRLGIQFRGTIDFGVKEQDWRGILKVTGEEDESSDSSSGGEEDESSDSSSGSGS